MRGDIQFLLGWIFSIVESDVMGINFSLWEPVGYSKREVDRLMGYVGGQGEEN